MILTLLNEKYLHLCGRLMDRYALVANASTHAHLTQMNPAGAHPIEELFEARELGQIESFVWEKSPEICARASMSLEEWFRTKHLSDLRVYESLALRFPNLCRQMYAIVEVVEKLVRGGRLALVLVENDVRPLQRAAIQTARMHGVPTLCLAHGVPSLVNLHDRVHADVMAVYGERCRRWYRAAGVEDDQLAVTGAVPFDLHYQLRKRGSKVEARRKLDLPPDRPVVVLATTWRSGLYLREYAYEVERVVEDSFRALGAVQNRLNFQLVLKLHPSDPYAESEYARVAGRCGATIHSFYPREFNMPQTLAPLLAAADVLACYQSTIGLEALLYGAGVISLSLHVPEVCFIEAESVLKADSGQAFEDALWQLLEADRDQDRGAAMERDLCHFNAGNDGLATERVCALIDRMVTGVRAQGSGVRDYGMPTFTTPIPDPRSPTPVP